MDTSRKHRLDLRIFDRTKGRQPAVTRRVKPTIPANATPEKKKSTHGYLRQVGEFESAPPRKHMACDNGILRAKLEASVCGEADPVRCQERRRLKTAPFIGQVPAKHMQKSGSHPRHATWFRKSGVCFFECPSSFTLISEGVKKSKRRQVLLALHRCCGFLIKHSAVQSDAARQGIYSWASFSAGLSIILPGCLDAGPKGCH